MLKHITLSCMLYLAGNHFEMTKFEVLKVVQTWSNFFNNLTGLNITDLVPHFDDTFEDRQYSLRAYEEKHLQTITWRKIGEALYSCKEESVLTRVLQCLKPTAGMLPHRM